MDQSEQQKKQQEQQKAAQMERARQVEEMQDGMLKSILEPAALKRLNNIQFSRPDNYRKIKAQVLSMAQQIREPISEAKLIDMAEKLTAKPEQSKIRIVRK